MRHRHTIRLLKHNYSTPQTYSVTIGAYHHYQLFGHIKNKIFIPSDIGTIINHTLISLPEHHHCQLIIYQLMPNHLHFIIKILKPDIRAQPAAPQLKFGIQPNSLPCIIRSLKSECTKQVHQQEIYLSPIFQRNYYEHIIRDKTDLENCEKYILDNPKNWFYDSENKSKPRNKL